MGGQIGMLVSLKGCDYEDLCFVLVALWLDGGSYFS